MVPRGLARTTHEPARMSGDVADGGSGHATRERRALARELCHGIVKYPMIPMIRNTI